MENSKITCPGCGAETSALKFCPECGALLRKAGDPLPMDAVLPGEASLQHHPNPAPSPVAKVDDGLTLLADYCVKRVATVGGDGHREVCLYLDDISNSYCIITYEYYEGMPNEISNRFEVNEEKAKEALSRIEKTRLHKLENRRGVGPCGGATIVKYRHKGKMVRITSDNIPFPDRWHWNTKLSSVGSILYDCLENDESGEQHE